MITIHEVIRRAKKGESFFTSSPARNATAAAAKLGRTIETKQFFLVAVRGTGTGKRILQVRVIS